MEKDTHLLEINLISAQGLKTPSAKLRRLQTYAVVWADPSAKLRTQVDRVGGENPTWNEKFLFRVSSQFLFSDTSGISVEVYAVGCFKDPLVGTVRFLLSSCISRSSSAGTPVFSAVQIRRPSGRFHGVLNIAATFLDNLDIAAAAGSSAICFRDLARVSRRRRRRQIGLRGSEKKSDRERSSGEFLCGDSVDLSDDAGSTGSSCSITVSTPLKEWNGDEGSKEKMAGKRDLKSDSGGLLCGLVTQRKAHLSPSDQIMAGAREKEN